MKTNLKLGRGHGNNIQPADLDVSHDDFHHNYE